MSDQPLRILSEVLPQFRVAALAYVACAAEELAELIREVEKTADGDQREQEARLSSLLSAITSRRRLSAQAGWPTDPICEITLTDHDHRDMALKALAGQRKRLVNQLLDPGRAAGSKSSLIQDVRLLTTFLRAAGVKLAASNGQDIRLRRNHQGGPNAAR